MMTFLNWLSANPAAFLFLMVAVNVFMIVVVVAFIQGRTIDLWPPKIGPWLDVPRQRVLVGDVRFPGDKHPNFYDGSYLDGRDVDVPVRFKIPYKYKPDVVVGLQMFDAGIQICRVKVEARNVAPDGFNLRFETWKDSRLWNATAVWVAVGE